MKRLLLSLLILVTSCQAAITLVQSNMGGNLSSSGSGPLPANFNTSSVGFASNTTSGDLLLCVVYVDTIITGGNNLSDTTASSCSTSGVTWGLIAGGPALGWGGYSTSGYASVFADVNAPQVLSSTTTQVNVTVNPGTTTTYNVHTQFMLYEFGGVATASALDGTALYASGSASTPNPGSKTTTVGGDLILSAYSASSGTDTTAGSGYTLGIDATSPMVSIGQLQWQVVGGASSYATAFGGSVAGSWMAVAQALKPASPPSTLVVRRKGSVF